MVGAGMLLFGVFMIVQGVEHIRSGLPIPGNRFLAESTGWDTFIAGIVAVGMGCAVGWLGVRRRP